MQRDEPCNQTTGGNLHQLLIECYTYIDGKPQKTIPTLTVTLSVSLVSNRGVTGVARFLQGSVGVIFAHHLTAALPHCT
jgi:hypothetical protein